LASHSFLFYGCAFLAIIAARYFLIAGSTHLIFYPFRQDTSTQRSILQDIQLSLVTSIVFALCAAGIMSAYESGLTRLYADVGAYPLWYLGLSYVGVLMIQDTYFYFVHRLFHHPVLFAHWHQGHHRSHPATPWTAFAFDPLEAIVQSMFLLAIVFVMPLHFITVIAVLTTMTIWAVVNHLGVDRLPLSFPHHWFGRWFIGPAHHTIHHKKYGRHYGLYFTFWDRYLGSNDPHYEDQINPSAASQD
jgi:Delta7-sterol 5-desaturase